MRTEPYNLFETPLAVIVPLCAGALSTLAAVWGCVFLHLSLPPEFIETTRIALNTTYIVLGVVATITGIVGGVLLLMLVEKRLNRLFNLDAKVAG